MKKLFRAFSQNYPFLSRTKSYHKPISTFPLSFATSKTSRDTDVLIPQDSEEYKGLIKIYEVFINSLISQDLSDLDYLLESNLIFRARSSLKALNENEFKLYMKGSLKSAQIFNINESFYKGSILPQRNLNFPSEYYYIEKNKIDCQESCEYKFKSLVKQKIDFSEFKDLDLDQINQSDDLQPYRDQVTLILTGMNTNPIENNTYDYGIFTNFKVFAKDKSGNIVAGKDDDEFEFHTLRVESFGLESKFMDFSVPWGYDANKFYSEKLGNYLNQYTLTDIDGFMNGNLIIPQH